MSPFLSDVYVAHTPKKSAKLHDAWFTYSVDLEEADALKVGENRGPTDEKSRKPVFTAPEEKPRAARDAPTLGDPLGDFLDQMKGARSSRRTSILPNRQR
jgi:hypothetical protein